MYIYVYIKSLIARVHRMCVIKSRFWNRVCGKSNYVCLPLDSLYSFLYVFYSVAFFACTSKRCYAGALI